MVSSTAMTVAEEQELARFEHLGSWEEITWESPPSLAPRLLNDYAAQTAALSSAEIRRLLVRLVERTSPRSLDERIFVYCKAFVWLRTAFRIPPLVPVGTVGNWGGFMRPEPPRGYWDAAWPLEVSDGGETRLVGVFRGYMGVDYNPVGEFDEFVKAFPRR